MRLKSVSELLKDSGLKSPYDRAFRRWHEKARARAYEMDPRYRAIENIRSLNSVGNTSLWIAEDLGLGLEESEYQFKKEVELTPKPLYLKTLRWMDQTWAHHKPPVYVAKFKHAKQRIKRGYSQYDLYGFDSYIGEVISNALTDWVNQPPMGWPGPPMTYEEWLDILRDIAGGFKAGLEARDIRFSDPVRYAELITAFDKGFGLFHQYFFHLWD